MEMIRTLFARVASLFGSRQLDRDLDDELRAHIELAAAENRCRGLSPAEARSAALRAFGGVTQTSEAYRVQRGIPLIEQIARDVRFATRQLRKSPAFALTAILTLGLGLGANTAVFSLINALLLRPLPVPHADELAVLHFTRSDDPDPNFSFFAPMFRALEKRHEAFSSIASFTGRTMQVRSSTGNVAVPGAMVSGEFFSLMQVQPLLGRYLMQQDDQQGGAPTGFALVLSESFWQSWFNRAPDVVGRRLTIANAPFTIVGVMPKTFIGGDPTARPQIFVPLWSEPIIDAPYDNMAAGYHSQWMRVMVRRRPGVSLEHANAALGAMSNRILEETAPGDAKWIAQMREHHFELLADSGSRGYTYLRSRFSKPLTTVFALCGLMLLLACLNLAGLLIARSAARERELATRLAMGATRRRLIQQLMIESLLIALLGTAAGMIAAPAVSRSLATLVLGHASFPQQATSLLDTGLDLRVFAFIALIAIVSAVLIGLAPALRATSKDLNEQIKASTHTTAAEKRSMLPSMLMAFEVALALVLVVGAGLLATSVYRIYRTGLGFDPRNIVEIGLDMNKQPLDGAPLLRWYREYGESLSRLPGVKSVSYGDITPMDGSVWTRDYHTATSGGDREIYMNTVSPGYFDTLRIPLLAGRDVAWTDTMDSSRKIVLSSSAAKYLLPGLNPIGQQISTTDDGTERKYEVVGVVGDIRYASMTRGPVAGAYIPIAQDNGHKPSHTAVVCIEGSAAPLAAAARQLAAQTAPDIPAPNLRAMNDDLDASISSERMMALLAVFFAGCALLVTAIGLYGTLAYSTARRTCEIGIRMALGAQRSQVVGLVFLKNAWVTLWGSLIGLALALLAVRVLASFLYSTSVYDPWILAASVVALAAVSSAASILPALRASRVQPVDALRTE